MNIYKPRLLSYVGGFSPLGGIETFTCEFLRHFCALGYATTCLCWGFESDLLRDMKTSGVQVVRQGFRWGCRFGLPDLLLSRKGADTILQSDIVIFRKLFSDSIHHKLHNMRTQPGYPSFVYITAYRPAEMWGERVPAKDTLDSMDVIVTQCRAFADDLRHFGYRGNIRIMPLIPAVEKPVVSFPCSKGVIRIGFLGRLEDQKNISYLFEAFAVLIAQRGGFQYELHLYGDGAKRKSLEAKAHAMGIESKVTFHGTVRHERVGDAVDSCHFFAISSVSEGQCIAALDVISRGRPLVATPVGALPDILSDPELGLLAPLEQPQSFANGLSQVANMVASGKTSPEKVRAVYDARFSRVAVLKGYRDLMRDLLERNNIQGKVG